MKRIAFIDNKSSTTRESRRSSRTVWRRTRTDTRRRSSVRQAGLRGDRRVLRDRRRSHLGSPPPTYEQRGQPDRLGRKCAAERPVQSAPQLKTALLNRLVRNRTAGFGLCLSTGGELALGTPSIQYVPFPRFNTSRLDDRWKIGTIHSQLRPCVLRLAGVDGTAVRDLSQLTSSAWTAQRIELVYGTSPEVLYPPVAPVARIDTILSDHDWEGELHEGLPNFVEQLGREHFQ